MKKRLKLCVRILFYVTVVSLALFASQVAAQPNFSDWLVQSNLGLVVNSAYNHAGHAISRDGPSLLVRFDGLEAFFYSGRAGGSGGQDLWTATRESVIDPWSAPVNLGPLVNSSAVDQRPYIASDRRTLYFASNRAGGLGDNDLYITTRTRQKP